MTNHNNASRSLKNGIKCLRDFSSTLLLILTLAISHPVSADELPKVTGTSFDGTTIIWQALDGAIGYNIYYQGRYLATVVGTTEFAPDANGLYTIAAFDGNGNFSPLQRFNPDGSPASNFTNVESVNLILPPPQNAFGVVFSTTAGEIYWDKDSSRNLIYHVSVNGKFAGATEGNSFWLDSLIPEQENLIKVNANTVSGSTSDTVNLIFDTTGNVYPIEAADTELPPSTMALESPKDVFLERYASTIAELFWSRETLGIGISTEVYRDDVLLGITPGNSFYDDNRTANVRHTYELVTVNENDDRSDSTYINPTAFDDTDALTIANTFIERIAEAATANPHAQWFPFFQLIGFGDLPADFVEVSTETINNDGVVVTTTDYDCGSGTLTAVRTTGFVSTSDLRFEGCGAAPALLYGNVSIFSEGGLLTTVNYGNVEIYAEEVIAMDGEVSMRRARGTDARSIDYNNFDYYVFGDFFDEEFTDTSVILNQRVAFAADNASAPSTFSTTMTVNAPWTNGFPIEVSTVDPFLANDTSGGNYFSGSLIAEAANGERVVLTADTGDSSTWNVQVITTDATDSVNGVWDEDNKLPCIVLDGNCN